MKKRIILILMLGVVLFALTGCGGGDDVNNEVDQAVEQNKEYAVTFEFTDIAGDLANIDTFTIDGVELKKEGDFYIGKFEKGEYNYIIDNSNNSYVSDSGKITINEEEHWEFNLFGKFENEFVDSEFDFKFNYPFDWVENKIEEDSSEVHYNFKHPNSKYPSVSVVKVIVDNEYNNELFSEFINDLEAEYNNDFEIISIEEYKYANDNLVGEFLLTTSIEKGKIITTYIKNKIYLFMYFDDKEDFD
ncbi:MAG: hypothetical protein ACOCRK_10985, partial [bacterium]